MVTIAAGQCSANARFDEVNTRLDEISSDLRGITDWIKEHATGHPSSASSTNPVTQQADGVASDREGAPAPGLPLDPAYGRRDESETAER